MWGQSLLVCAFVSASLDSTYVVSGHAYLQSAIVYVVDANERCNTLGWLTRTNMCGVCASSVTDDKGLVDTSHNGQLFSNVLAACSYLHQGIMTLCYRNVGEKLSILASVYEFFILSDLPSHSHSGLFKQCYYCKLRHSLM